jgi:predicted DNA-binding transcriptional regulator AlpA
MTGAFDAYRLHHILFRSAAFLNFAIVILEGSRSPSIIGLLLLGLALIATGDQIYMRWKRKLINKRQVAEIFAVSQSTIERWLEDGKLPKPKKFLGLRRWDSDEVTARLKFKRFQKRKS